MSDGNPPDDMFGGLPFMADLMKLLQGQTSGSNDTARQLAHTIANDGQSEPNIDPADRIAVEQLIRVAELQVASLTELSTGPITVEVGNRSQWADRTITDYRPLFETLSDSMSQGLQLPDDLPTGDPMAAMMANLTQMMGPMMLGMTTGSMVGHLARRALGGFDLPVPRAADTPILVLLRNVDEFGDAWSLDRDDLRLWVCLHEVAHQAVLNVPHVRERLTDLLQRHAAAFESDPARITDQLGGFDPMAGPEALADMQNSLSNPELVLGGCPLPRPRGHPTRAHCARRRHDRLHRLGDGLDWRVTDRLLRDGHRGASATSGRGRCQRSVRRTNPGARARCRAVRPRTAFAGGVVERTGAEGLRRLFDDPAPADPQRGRRPGSLAGPDRSTDLSRRCRRDAEAAGVPHRSGRLRPHRPMR